MHRVGITFGNSDAELYSCWISMVHWHILIFISYMVIGCTEAKTSHSNTRIGSKRVKLRIPFPWFNIKIHFTPNIMKKIQQNIQLFILQARKETFVCERRSRVLCVCVCALYMVRCARLRADTQNETLWIVMTGGMMVRQQPNNKRTNPCTSIGIGQVFQIQCGCLHVSTPTQYVFFVFFSFCYHRYFQRVRQTWTNQQIFRVVILNNRTWYGAAVIPMLIQRWLTVVFCVNP